MSHIIAADSWSMKQMLHITERLREKHLNWTIIQASFHFRCNQLLDPISWLSEIVYSWWKPKWADYFDGNPFKRVNIKGKQPEDVDRKDRRKIKPFQTISPSNRCFQNYPKVGTFKAVTERRFYNSCFSTRTIRISHQRKQRRRLKQRASSCPQVGRNHAQHRP